MTGLFRLPPFSAHWLHIAAAACYAGHRLWQGFLVCWLRYYRLHPTDFEYPEARVARFSAVVVPVPRRYRRHRCVSGRTL